MVPSREVSSVFRLLVVLFAARAFGSNRCGDSKRNCVKKQTACIGQIERDAIYGEHIKKLTWRRDETDHRSCRW